jgi:hypothetical protein
MREEAEVTFRQDPDDGAEDAVEVSEEVARA